MHDLSDPNVVHLNMLRGTIAKPSLAQIIHIYGRKALAVALDDYAALVTSGYDGSKETGRLAEYRGVRRIFDTDHTHDEKETGNDKT